jgi:hypothetical protein
VSNELTKFEGDKPPSDHVYLYWDREDQKWRIWFGEEAPMFKSGDYDRFDYKLHRYKLVRRRFPTNSDFGKVPTMTSFEDDRDRVPVATTSFQDGRNVPEWTPGKSPSMTSAELEAYEKTTAALRDRSAALEDDTKRLAAETEEMKKHRLEMEAHTERMMQLGCKRQYQQEINSVSINVLVSILTKDALKGIRDSEFTESTKLDVGKMVEFALIVGKRYVDELHRISVSAKQLEEYKDQIQSQMMQYQQPGAMPPVAMPPE